MLTVNDYSGGGGGSGGGSGSIGDDGALGGNDGHDIKIDNSDKKGTAVTENPKAIPTDKVIIDVENIQKGYRVIRVIVRDENGKEIKTSRVDGDSFSFIMPDSPVTVEPVYGLSATPPHESGVSEMLITDEHIIFMDGYPDNTFKPNANVRRCEVAQIFYALLRNKNVPLTADFDDLAEGAWYETAVRTMASLGVVSGVGNNKFDPERPITRLEFAVMASKFAKSTDLTANHVLVGAFVNRAVELASKADGVRVDSTNSNDTDFEKNLVSVRAEAREIVAVKRPACFCDITVS